MSELVRRALVGVINAHEKLNNAPTIGSTLEALGEFAAKAEDFKTTANAQTRGLKSRRTMTDLSAAYEKILTNATGR